MAFTPAERLERRRAQSRAWNKRNPERIRAASIRWKARNPDYPKKAYQKRVSTEEGRAKILESARIYRANNAGKYNAYRRRYYKERRRTDPAFKLRSNLSSRLWNVLKDQNVDKEATTFELCGCTLAELVAHLEKQFTPEMTWENYGDYWHVDHIIACAKFNLLDEQQQRACFHYSNLQPLYWEDNVRKGAR